MTKPPFQTEPEPAPSIGRMTMWIVLLLVLIAGLVLYFRFGTQVNPLLDLESVR